MWEYEKYTTGQSIQWDTNIQIHTGKEIHKDTENEKSFDVEYKPTLN